MKKRWTAILMILMMLLALTVGCEDQSSNSRSSRNSRNDESETSDSVEALSFNTTEDFNEMMDAYKDFYNEFCEENLKPYYEDSSECDCAAMLVVNPDNNKIMMVIADFVGFNSSSGANVDLCFYEYSRGEVREYLKILNIWIDDTIFVGNIADGLYVSHDHPNGNDLEYVHYRIENGEAKEITPTADVNGGETRSNGWWIDINTNDGVYQYSWHGSLTECIVTDNTDANYCVSERLFENYLDYLKDHRPESITDLKVIYGDYLLENRVTTRPGTFILYDGIEYYYVREERLFDDIPVDMRGYLFPRVNDLLAYEYEYPESIDGYEVYPHLEEVGQIEAALSDENYRTYQRFFRRYDDYVCRFIDIEGDGTPELLVSSTTYDGDTIYYCTYYIYEGSVREDYDNHIEIIGEQVYGDIEENYTKVYELEYYSSIEEAWLAYNNLAYNN